MVKEVNVHVENIHWTLFPIESVPEDTDILPSVWSMQKKRNIVTNEITKYKARLNVHGGKQDFGENYFYTYATFVTWFAIRILIIYNIVLKWQLRQSEFIMAYTKSPIECDMYLNLTYGIATDSGNSRTYVLKLLRSVYVQKQADKVFPIYYLRIPSRLDYRRETLISACFTEAT